MTPKYRLSTKDLVTIALLSAVGGAMSTYVGYLGNLVNHIVGVPFGAGQFMAGLHVLWIMLVVGITRKKGTGTATGVLKGFVELFMGGTHGIVIVVVSAIQGLLVDLLLLSDKSKEDMNIYRYSLAGAAASASNVLVFQAFFFSGVPFMFIAMICMLAAASGIIFAGWLSIEMLQTLEYAGLVQGKTVRFVDTPEAKDMPTDSIAREKRRTRLAAAVVAIFLTVFTIGAVYYFAFVFQKGPSEYVSIEGEVANPYRMVYDDFAEYEVTINAELIGSVTHATTPGYHSE
jgi:energy-coupling factor transport system substrate-specific component